MHESQRRQQFQFGSVFGGELDLEVFDADSSEAVDRDRTHGQAGADTFLETLFDVGPEGFQLELNKKGTAGKEDGTRQEDE